MLAAVGAGYFKDTGEAAARWVRIARTHEPDPKAKAEYDAMYEKYRLIYGRLRGDFKTLWGGG
jgi:sugar (pentulose or hexulose) kinase